MQRALSLIVMCVLACIGSPLRAAPADLHDLDQVMGMLAMRQHGRVEFVEQQFLAVLSRPIESSGELRYDAPDRLEKRTLKPHAETLVLAGEQLSVERAGRRRVMDLHAYPQVLPFVESIRATLAGDRKALERLFRRLCRQRFALDLDASAPGIKGQAIRQPGSHRRRGRPIAEGGNSPAGR